MGTSAGFLSKLIIIGRLRALRVRLRNKTSSMSRKTLRNMQYVLNASRAVGTRLLTRVLCKNVSKEQKAYHLIKYHIPVLKEPNLNITSQK